MAPNYHKIHNRFKLNGFSFSKEELKEVGYSLVKEGEAHESGIGDFLLDWLSDRPTIEVKTSGSTGKPKYLTLGKQAMVNSAIATGDFFRLTKGDSSLLCLSVDYIAGKMMLVRAMILGLELDYVAPSPKPLSTTNKTYDFAAMVPMQLEASLEKIDQVKTLIVGGAPISDNLKKSVQGKKARIFETYGMTETITHIAARRINGIRSHTEPKDKKVPGTGSDPLTFKTLPNVSLSKDKRDCLVVNAPDINNEAIVTNDLVNLVSDTEFEWLGRYDNAINSGGIKLIPEQIEAKLSAVLDTRFFVTGMADATLGKKLVLIVEGKADADKLLETVKTSDVLLKYEMPKEVVTLDKFADTKNGKIQRTKTLEQIPDPKGHL